MFAALFACGDDEGGGNEDNGDSTLGATCARICQRSSAADCAGDVKSECARDCVQEATQSVPAACKAQLDTLFACAVKATYTCDADDEAQPVGCDNQTTALGTCIQQNLGGAPVNNNNNNDAGTLPLPNNNDASTSKPDASMSTGGNDGGFSGALLCMPAADDEACDTCSKSKCCAEYTACGADCQALSICLSDCVDEACTDTCLEQHPVGSEQLLDIGRCFEEECPVECGDEEENPLCLSTSVPPGYCNDPNRPVGLDCPAGVPTGDCVLSSTGAANVYCCAE